MSGAAPLAPGGARRRKGNASGSHHFAPTHTTCNPGAAHADERPTRPSGDGTRVDVDAPVSGYEFKANGEPAFVSAVRGAYDSACRWLGSGR